ncbi:MAG: hypothetical protein LBU65_12355, partial [Planctomycetaceae bacterium]|nr:hypothetical protein [Planctomycetaceae bacterium]
MQKHFFVLLFFVLTTSIVFCGEHTAFERDFAPSESWVKPPESEFRSEICLNGAWLFQGVDVPSDWKYGNGLPPLLGLPSDDGWDETRIKIPSAWNVNTWGNGRDVGEGTPRPYWADSVYYPSYPPRWDGLRMAWMKRSVVVPPYWAKKRYLLHFEAVSGAAEIYVNGKKVGENFGRFLPFEIDVTDAVKVGEANEILVGVRSLRLFDKTSGKYARMKTPYPPGSNMDNINGIWQDVYLLAVPTVRIDDVFVKPFVSRDTLEVEVTLKNESDKPVRANVNGNVFTWTNNADKSNIVTAAEPSWQLDMNVVLTFDNDTPRTVEIQPKQTEVITIKTKVNNKLKLWSMDEPNLYGLITDISADGRKVDTKYTRFGWREFRIVGKELQLNGKAVKLYGDLLHPFGPFISSRRYVMSWYSMVKEMHGNAVRPHAQPHPRIYAELADEMGLAVLAETAMFGSSIQLNFEEPAAWERFTEHYKRLILRDRNHPSVFGWSWGNELFAIFIYDKAITPEQTDVWYRQLTEYGKSGIPYDPTRDWFSCDGDGDFRGTMPVWNKHFGHGTEWRNELPKDVDKPIMVGEQGGTYYARPSQLANFNSDRAYENYRGRNEALAIDVYNNVVENFLGKIINRNLANTTSVPPNLTFFSPAETAWFGLEHLNFGYNDFTRLPNRNDGVFFTKPFEENKPGVQIERLPPYAATFNPGWDKTLPLFKPLPMFEAQKLSLAPTGVKPLPEEYKNGKWGRSVSIMSMESDTVLFLGDTNGELYKRLDTIGTPLRPLDDKISGDAFRRMIVIVDGNTFNGD